MVTLRYQDRVLDVEDGETVLDALERGGFAPRSSCRGGACQACVLRAREGAVPAKAQQGLKDAWQAQGYFLACQARPTTDLDVVDADDAGAEVRATLTERRVVNDDIAVLRLACAEPFAFLAGQFVHVVRGDGVSRPYSLASLPTDEGVELHVRRRAGGALSPWLVDEIAPGAAVVLRGPYGSCTYVAGRPEQPLLLVGVSTGLAPLYGVVRDALAAGHTGPITLYRGALARSGLYLDDELAALQAAHPQVTVVSCALDPEGDPDVRSVPLDRAVLDDHPAPAGARAFLCGDPPLVQGLKKKLFLAGMPLKDIHSDPFLAATAPG